MLRPTPKLILFFIAAVLLFSSTINAQSGSGKIVFAEDSGRLLLINADGTGQTILTPGGSVLDDNPVYSPDGSKIAFNRNIGFKTDIYVMNADGTNVVALTTATPQLDFSINMHPSWSPDGSKIVFSSNRNGQRKSEIWVMNANGTGLVQLTANIQLGTDGGGPIFSGDGGPAWSPDGSRIVFNSTRDGLADTELYVMNADGSNQTRLTDNIADDRNPTWSPDSQRIAFDLNGTSNIGLNIINRDGSNLVNVVHDGFNPSWSPDGGRFVFVALDPNNDFKPAVYTINIDGTNKTKLTNNFSSSRAPSWAPASSAPISTFTISGVVKDGNGTPISGAKLDMFATFNSTTQTDNNGAYSFTGLPAGNYRIDISKAGFGFNPSSITINNLSTNQTVNFTAFVAFSISGTVTGIGASDILVNLTGTVNRTVFTNNGQYSFGLLPAGGNYTVFITSKFFNVTPSSVTFNNLSANQVANFDLVIAKYTISGTITRLGTPKQGITVQLDDTTGFTPPSTVTDANGHYSFTNVSAGRTYIVRPIGANYVFSPQTHDFSALDGDKIADFIALSANHLLFTQATRTVAEGIGTIQVTVARGGNAAGVGPITVDYTTEDGTAKAGEDYTAVSGTLSFPEGTFQRTITIPITEDLLRESTEQFSIKLMNPTGEVDLANPSTTLISITDNEPVLVTEPDTDRAITVNSVTRVAAPFTLITQPNFSVDTRTRISLFVEQVQFTPTFPAIVITAVDAQQNQFQLPLEAVIGFSRFPFAEFVVRLPENLSSGDLFVTVTVNGSPSNVGRISVKP